MENIKKISHHKGEIAVLYVELEANRRGYIVNYPRNSNSLYDMIVDNGKELLKVQVKYLNRRKSNAKDILELDLTNKSSSRKFYTKEDINLLLVYVPAIDKILYFLPHNFDKKTSIRVHLTDQNSKYFYGHFLW